MLISEPGKITDELYLLGAKHNIIYLVEGRESMLIGGGMSWIAPYLEKQLLEFNIDLGKIKYLVIQHAHFDHCGVVPYLKRKLPDVLVLGTESAKSILSKDKVIDYIEAINRMMVDFYGFSREYDGLNLRIDSINIDMTVHDSTVIDLGNDLDIHFIETPGHSPCAVSVYIPKLKAIFPTDSAPCPMGSIDNLARPSPQFDFTLYMASLKKLMSHDIEICGFDHYAAAVGEDANKVLQNAFKYCREYEQRIAGLYRETKDMEEISRQVARETIASDKFDFLSEDLMLPISRAEVRNILKAAGVLDI
ncbi:MAG: MBL fold metallo-hydrolase [Chloroflexi bacterium]|nr:MBL fold metallo-hydrolase [Chloroflexota bacterium]